VESIEAPASKRGVTGGAIKPVNPESRVALSQVKLTKGSNSRFSSLIGELDRCLGGGLVPGMVVLMGGEPGIGKSTLLTQMVVGLAADQKIVYVAGEESPQQIMLRIQRICEAKKIEISEKMKENVVFFISTDADEIGTFLQQEQPAVVIVDSIQTMETTDLMGAAGSAGQVRETADRLTQIAKKIHIPMFLVGHVTKEGVIAGPKILEHIVDTVLELSGERTGELRLLRAIKNRFGATDEVGVFRLSEAGLDEVTNPSELFIEEAMPTGRQAGQQVAGSAVACVMEGTRPLVIEVQALVTETQLAMPRRVGRGMELSRIQVLGGGVA
jgi:DNA repair protein RadA/Sms